MNSGRNTLIVVFFSVDGMSDENTTDANYTMGDFVIDNLGEADATLRKKPFLFQVETPPVSSVLFQLMKDVTPGTVSLDGSESVPSSDRSAHSASASVPAALAALDISDLRVLSVGGAQGGLPPHKHAAAWLGLVLGKKQWAFFPPNALSPVAFAASGVEGVASFDLYAQAALNSPLMWSDELRTVLKGGTGVEGGQGLLECTQRPSEVIYVPRSWWHATGNIGDVIGIGGQAASLYSHSLVSDARPLHEASSGSGISSESAGQYMYKGCATTIADLCTSVQLYSPTSAEGLAVRKAIQDVTAATANEEHRHRGGSGLTSEGSVDVCNAVAHRQSLKTATDLEPLNIKFILAYAKSLYMHPLEHLSNRFQSITYDPIVSSSSNPLMRAAKFIQGRVKKTFKQYKLKHISATDAKQLVLRMGLFLDDLPALAGAALACPNTPTATTCGTWGMNHACEKKFSAILNETVKIFMSFEDDTEPVLDSAADDDVDTTGDGDGNGDGDGEWDDDALQSHREL
jgi:hypothetical protein